MVHRCYGPEMSGVTRLFVTSGVPEVCGPVGRDAGQLGTALHDLDEPCAKVRNHPVSFRFAGRVWAVFTVLSRGIPASD